MYTVYVYVYLYVCVYAYVYVCVYLCIFMCIYIYVCSMHVRLTFSIDSLHLNLGAEGSELIAGLGRRPRSVAWAGCRSGAPGNPWLLGSQSSRDPGFKGSAIPLGT